MNAICLPPSPQRAPARHSRRGMRRTTARCERRAFSGKATMTTESSVHGINVFHTLFATHRGLNAFREICNIARSRQPIDALIRALPTR
eukprot:gene11166-biopygen9322